MKGEGPAPLPPVSSRLDLTALRTGSRRALGVPAQLLRGEGRSSSHLQYPEEATHDRGFGNSFQKEPQHVMLDGCPGCMPFKKRHYEGHCRHHQRKLGDSLGLAQRLQNSQPSSGQQWRPWAVQPAHAMYL